MVTNRQAGALCLGLPCGVAWRVYGEGPTRQARRGGLSERQDRPFTASDVRFTRSKDGKTLYAIAFGWTVCVWQVQLAPAEQPLPDRTEGTWRGGTEEVFHCD